MSSPKYLFVYGSLRRHHTPPEMAELMGNLEFVAAGSTSGHVFDLGEYPGAVFDPASTSRVVGEVYKLPNKPHVLRKLDSYEEFKPRSRKQSLFVRESIAVQTSDGEELNCWAYRINKNALKKRASHKQPIRTLRPASTRAAR